VDQHIAAENPKALVLTMCITDDDDLQ
jgi:hypothetical protein